MDSIFSRISVRQFEDKSVEPEKIEMLLKAAFAAPTAGNQQPWEFFIVTNQNLLKSLSETSPYATPAAHAPAALVICYRQDGLRFPEYAQIDCAICSENVLLELETQGLGGVMLGIAPLEDRMQAVAKVLNLPENLAAFTIIPFGYAKERHPQKDRYDAAKVHYLN
ncbi:MAG: nitroreductase family protein [Desulfovibrionaceae bacterium]|nr:nitroreductase family protein [Desulfovibrionaceae bacterium]